VVTPGRRHESTQLGRCSKRSGWRTPQARRDGRARGPSTCSPTGATVTLLPQAVAFSRHTAHDPRAPGPGTAALGPFGTAADFRCGGLRQAQRGRRAGAPVSDPSQRSRATRRRGKRTAEGPDTPREVLPERSQLRGPVGWPGSGPEPSAPTADLPRGRRLGRPDPMARKMQIAYTFRVTFDIVRIRSWCLLLNGERGKVSSSEGGEREVIQW
jgi:hypothetical protein